MDSNLYRQRFAELIVRERDVTGQLPAEFAVTYARHVEAVNRRHWVAALASYMNAKSWIRLALLDRLYYIAEAVSHFDIKSGGWTKSHKYSVRFNSVPPERVPLSIKSSFLTPTFANSMYSAVSQYIIRSASDDFVM